MICSALFSSRKRRKKNQNSFAHMQRLFDSETFEITETKPSAMSHLSFVLSTFTRRCCFSRLLNLLLTIVKIKMHWTFTESNLKLAMSNAWRLSYLSLLVLFFFSRYVFRYLNPEHLLLEFCSTLSHLPNWKLSGAYSQYTSILFFCLIHISFFLSVSLSFCIFLTIFTYFCASDKNRFYLRKVSFMSACWYWTLLSFILSILQWFSISVFTWFIAFSAYITSPCIKFTSSYCDTGTKTRYCTGSKSSIRQVSAFSDNSNKSLLKRSI